MLPSIHRIPCSIEYNGSAPISDYFIVEPNEQGGYKASFRGRPWIGHVVKLDDSIQGKRVRNEHEHEHERRHSSESSYSDALDFPTIC